MRTALLVISLALTACATPKVPLTIGMDEKELENACMNLLSGDVTTEKSGKRWYWAQCDRGPLDTYESSVRVVDGKVDKIVERRYGSLNPLPYDDRDYYREYGPDGY